LALSFDASLLYASYRITKSTPVNPSETSQIRLAASPLGEDLGRRRKNRVPLVFAYRVD